jgi:NADH:ubiquinone oxidoreductase subunit D
MFFSLESIYEIYEEICGARLTIIWEKCGGFRISPPELLEKLVYFFRKNFK